MQMQRPFRLTLHYNELHNREYQRFNLLLFDTNFFTFEVSPSRGGLSYFFVFCFLFEITFTSNAGIIISPASHLTVYISCKWFKLGGAGIETLTN